MPIRTSVTLIAAFIAPVLVAEQPAGTQSDPLAARFVLDVGGFFPALKTTARLDSPTLGRGTEISLENDLDLSDREFLGFAQFTARLSRRWRTQAGGRLATTRSRRKTCGSTSRRITAIEASAWARAASDNSRSLSARR